MKTIATSFSTKTMIVVLISMVLSACGFHLRGNYLVPQEIHHISLTSFDKYSQLTRNIEASLRLNEVTVVSPASSVPNLHLISESVSERTLSLYQNSRAAEKELTYRTSFRMTIPERGTKTYSTTVTRNYLDNPRTALAKSVERDMIEDEMRLQAASQIMRQLARFRVQLDEDSIQFDPQTEVQQNEPTSELPSDSGLSQPTTQLQSE